MARKRTMHAFMFLAVALVTSHAQAQLSTSQRNFIRTCPAGTNGTVVNGELKCTLVLKCASGYEAFPATKDGKTGLICFKRQNLLAAADCNNCGIGVHVQTPRENKDTCTPPIGKHDPSKLKCCQQTSRWQDKDGQTDVCGTFAAPEAGN